MSAAADTINSFLFIEIIYSYIHLSFLFIVLNPLVTFDKKFSKSSLKSCVSVWRDYKEIFFPKF